MLLLFPDSKVHGANMGPIWVLQDPGGPHVGPMNFAIWELLFLGKGDLFSNLTFQLMFMVYIKSISTCLLEF